MTIAQKIEHIQNMREQYLSARLEILSYTDDKSSQVAIDAIEALPYLYDKDIENIILNKLKNKNSLMRISALDAIYLPNDQEKIWNQIGELIKNKNWLVKAYAIELLGRYKITKYQHEINKLLKKTQNDELKIRIYYALIEFGHHEYLSSLFELLNHDYYRVRMATANTLYCLVNSENKGEFLDKINDRIKIENEKIVKQSLKNTLDDIEELFSPHG